MLEHLGEKEAAEFIVKAIERTVQEGVLTVDLAGSAKTVEVTERIVHNLKE